MTKYQINKSKNIGNVIFVVEGGKAESGGTELRLLKRIFADILDYEVQELRRGSDEFIAHGNNPNYRVFALNLPKNQLTQLTEKSIDELFLRLRREFSVRPEDCPIFFLYDRDVLSYGKNELRSKYVMKYTDPYGTDEGNQGQLLLSYPAIESYLLSCIKKDIYRIEYQLGKELKSILLDSLSDEQKNISEIVDIVLPEDNKVEENHLIHTIDEMNKGLESIGITEYDLDYLTPTLLGVYDYQQSKYNDIRKFSLISLFGMALLELGVISEADDEI